MRRFIIIALLLLPAITQAKKESAIIFHINDLDAAAQDIGKLMSMLDYPVPADLLPMQLGQILLLSPTLEGINRNGRFSIFVGLNPENTLGAMPHMAVLFPISNEGETYLNSLKQMLPDHSVSKEGINIFNVSPPGGPQKKYYVKLIGKKFALSGSDLETMSSMFKELSKEELKIIKTMPGRLSITLSPEIFSQELANQMNNPKMQKIKEGMKNEPTFQGDPEELLNIYANTLQNLLKQIRSYIINVDVGEQITLETYLKPHPGSVLDKIMIGETPVAPIVKALVAEKDAWISFWSTMGNIDELWNVYGTWATEIYTALGPPFESLTPIITDMMQDLKGLYSGDTSFALLPPKSNQFIRMKGVYGVNDAEKAQKLYNDFIEKYDTIMAQAQGGTNTFTLEKTECSEHNGVKIERYAFSMKIPEDQPGAEMINRIYENFNYDIAYMTNYMLFAMGEDELINECIELFQTGTTEDTDISGFDDVQAPLLGHLNLNIFQAIYVYANYFEEEKSQINVEQLKEMHGGIRAISYKKEDGYSSMLRITHEDLLNFKKLGTIFKKPAQPAL